MENLSLETLQAISSLAVQCRATNSQQNNPQMADIGGVAIPEAPACAKLIASVRDLDRDALAELTTLIFPDHGAHTDPLSLDELEDRARRQNKDPVALLVLELLQGQGQDIDQAVARLERQKP